jgi:hypothetical protein
LTVATPKGSDPLTSTPKEQSPVSVESGTTKHADSVSSELPKYLQLERKEVRLRLDQLDELTALTRRLNRARNGKGERITENTLIRVAIDLLLERSDPLAGTTEEELRDSVSP